MLKPGLVAIAVAALALVTGGALRLLLGGGGGSSAGGAGASSQLPLIVLAAPSAETWVRLERASGAAARIGTLDELTARGAGIVPADANLFADHRTRIVRWVEGGGKLVTPHAELLAALGFTRTASVAVDHVDIPALPGGALWVAHLPVEGLAAGPPLTLFSPDAQAEGAVVAATARRGKGSVLAIALNPVGQGRAGFELIPTLGREVAAWTGAPAGPLRFGAELYIDPGTLPPALKASPEQLAASVAADVRVVHLAGWDFNFRDPSDDYDYAGAIAAFHARGVLVDAWLEPPFVNLLMWEDHPECREKTQTGRDAIVDWRNLMALEDPACFEIAWQQWQTLLGKWSFDGVNVAELYFEPDGKPDDFTPFHPSVTKLFGAKPVPGDAFMAFRTELVTQLNAKLLARLRTLPRADELELVITAIDDHLDPSQARKVGSDMSRLAQVAKDYGASLQVEDPYTVWARGPLRYDDLSRFVAPLLEPGLAYLDINVVPREWDKPTPILTAGELDIAVMTAAQISGRLGLFSLGTAGRGDVQALSRAMGGAAETLDAGIRAPWTVVVRPPEGAAYGRLLVDGKPWPAASGNQYIPASALVPAGEHRTEWQAGKEIGPALIGLSGELGTASTAAGELTFSYSARIPALASLDQEPGSVEIDGRPAALSAMHSASAPGVWTLRLPAGTHEVRVRAK